MSVCYLWIVVTYPRYVIHVCIYFVYLYYVCILYMDITSAENFLILSPPKKIIPSRLLPPNIYPPLPHQKPIPLTK